MTQIRQLPPHTGASGAACSVSHVAGTGRSYPGEEVTLHTRVQLHAAMPGFRLRLWIPDGLFPVRFAAPDGTLPGVSPVPGGREVTWDVAVEPERPAYEFEVAVRAGPTPADCVLQTRATVEIDEGGAAPVMVSETAAIFVAAKARSLRHLPALYERDELMARFLMLFESFWRPMEQRIEHMHLYFDPEMAPAELLPWLASWLGLALDEHWSEAQRRQLIARAASLYRLRGTPQGLLEYLSILGEQAHIIEHRANNLILGAGSVLGQSVALGTENVPHTFTVVLTADPQGSPALGAPRSGMDQGGAADSSAGLLEERLRRVRTVIEAQKPAHTAYTVRVEAGPGTS